VRSKQTPVAILHAAKPNAGSVLLVKSGASYLRALVETYDALRLSPAWLTQLRPKNFAKEGGRRKIALKKDENSTRMLKSFSLGVLQPVVNNKPNTIASSAAFNKHS